MSCLEVGSLGQSAQDEVDCINVDARCTLSCLRLKSWTRDIQADGGALTITPVSTRLEAACVWKRSGAFLLKKQGYENQAYA